MIQNNYLEIQIKQIEKKITEVEVLKKDPQLAPLANKELIKLKKEKKQLLSLTKPKGKIASSFNNCIIEIRPAAGGDEAKIWANDLLRIYTRFANNMSWKTITLGNLSIKIYGKKAFEAIKYESGIHRVQRIPETESKGRIHTSTASVAVLPEVSEINIQIDPKNIDFQAFHASSQGGQNVQKVATAVRLTHKPTGIVVTCQTQRYQEQNRKQALEILRSKLWKLKEEKKQNQITQQRREAVGRGMRAEKIRTYNFPQNRITDHRLKKSWHNLNQVMDGNLNKIIQAFQNLPN